MLDQEYVPLPIWGFYITELTLELARIRPFSSAERAGFPPKCRDIHDNAMEHLRAMKIHSLENITSRGRLYITRT